jgi:hypothetical protein
MKEDSTKDGLKPAADNDVPITTCDDGSLCCGDEITGPPCCAQGKGVWLLNGKVVSTKPTSTAHSATTSMVVPSSTLTLATTTLSASTVSTSSDPAGKSSAPRDYTAIIVGSVLGGVLGLGLLIALLWFLTLRRRRSDGVGRNQQISELGSDGEVSELDIKGSLSELGMKDIVWELQQPPTEVAPQAVYELPSEMIAELKGSDLSVAKRASIESETGTL